MSQALTRSANAYFQEIAGLVPVTDPQEERRLIERWQKKGDVKARETLVQSHLRFVITVARKRSRDPERLQDLIAAGNIGLLTAVDKYDLTRKPAPRFLTYAGWWIQKEISDEDYATTTVVHVPTHRQKAQRKAAKLYQRVVQSHGPNAKQLKKMDPGAPEGQSVSLDDLLDTSAETLRDVWSKNHNDKATAEWSDAHGTEGGHDEQVLRRVISNLPTREGTVLNLYFGVKDEPRNFAEIAVILDMCPERVRQIKLNGVKLLKEEISKHPLLQPGDIF